MGTQTTPNKELFLSGCLSVLKEQKADVRLKPCDSRKKAAISAHKLILSARSEVFKKMFESDQCKASSRLETITLSELRHEELEAFVEFIYSDGSILSEKAKQHVRSLYRAADKYEIPHLRGLCRNELIATLDSSDALRVLTLAEIPLDQALSDAALKVIKINKSMISTSTEFEGFVFDHPNLTVQIVKAISAKCLRCPLPCCYCSYH
ncbi:unnamed protein product [Thlaspi arvense]|uniref:BTB domain-containing protein n=1 Tax=Thlaspi arvense TaxID=13288 RepID=A0AAU9SV04_THLAR|nr:unnamed protein product [Thlaspi arvense]